MATTTRLRRSSGLAAFTLLAALACDRATTPLAPVRSPSPAPSLVAQRTSSSTWNYYSAQVAISAEGGYPGFDRPDAYRSAVYTVQRTLGANNVWSTVMSIDQNQPFGPPPAGEFYGNDIARIETDDTHSYLRVYDRGGALIGNYGDPSASITSGNSPFVPDGASPMPTWPDLSVRPPSDTAPPDPGCGTQLICDTQPAAVSTPTATAGAAASLVAASGNGQATAAPPDRRREWIDAIVVIPETRGRARAALERRFGRPTEKVRGLDRFARRWNRTLTEVLVDPGTGAVVEENVAVDGELQSHVTHSYVEEEPGVFVRRTSRVEVAPSRPGASPRAMTVTLTNVRVGQLTEGGQQ